MNIFALSNCPQEAAQLQCDKHVVKMTLESAQIMSTVMHHYGDIAAPYKETHKHHPCVIWARESQANFRWLLLHFKALLEEYTHRYSKMHACGRFYETFLNFSSRNEFELADGTEVCQCMPEEFRGKDHVAAYREYYKSKPDWIRNYTNRKIPTFLVNK